jgi:hypothetical protein
MNDLAQAIVDAVAFLDLADDDLLAMECDAGCSQ